MTENRLRLLGGFEFQRDSAPPTVFPTRKTRALLAYLAAQPGRLHTREELAALLWEDSSEAQARASLRQTLSHLRKSAGDCLVSDGDTIALDPGEFNVDVPDFERLVADGTMEALARADALYRGDFLSGFDLRGERFEEWLAAERSRLRELAISALAKLLDGQAAAGETDRAIQAAVRLLAFDPLQEEIHRKIIRLYLQQGRLQSALRQYEACREVLRRELDAEPQPETEHLYREIRRQRNVPTGTDAAARGCVARLPKTRRSGAVAAGFAALLLAAGIAAYFVQQYSPAGVAATGPEDGVAGKIAALSAQPSIAVLPFCKLDGSPESDYFSAGITEDIITGLARHPDLQVASRSSSLAWQCAPVDIRQVERKLGVQYVLEGSVRRSGKSVRVTAQLIEAATDRHVWAQRYDNEGVDIFAIQDEVSEKIIGALAGGQGKVRKALYASVWKKDATSLEEYDYLLRGHAIFYEFTKDALAEARQVWREGLEKFPKSSLLRIKIAATHIHDARKGWTDTPRRDFARAYELVEDALADPKLPPIGQWYGHWMMSYLSVWHLRDFERAMAEVDATVAVVPKDSETLASLAEIAIFAGQPDYAIDLVERAMRQEPQIPGWYYWYLGWAWYVKGEYAQAVAELRKARSGGSSAKRLLAASLAGLGREEEARDVVAAVRKIDPTASLTSLREWLPYRNAADLERELSDLKKAGFPE